jgi:hypothetical protein
MHKNLSYKDFILDTFLKYDILLFVKNRFCFYLLIEFFFFFKRVISLHLSVHKRLSSQLLFKLLTRTVTIFFVMWQRLRWVPKSIFSGKRDTHTHTERERDRQTDTHALSVTFIYSLICSYFQVLARYSDHFANIAVQTVKRLKGLRKLRHILITEILGPTMQYSTLIDGIITNKHVVKKKSNNHFQTIQKKQNLKFDHFSGWFGLSKTHKERKDCCYSNWVGCLEITTHWKCCVQNFVFCWQYQLLCLCFYWLLFTSFFVSFSLRICTHRSLSNFIIVTKKVLNLPSKNAK